MTTHYDHELDVTGLNCPLPILRTKRELVRMQNGQVLRVMATDPHAVIDFLAFTEKTSNRMVEHWDEGGVYYFLVEKGG
ncbi:sulfurtransferase TusA family protein [Aquisalimonas sp.]|uniref:sulfurtransferase TusA family protein n=1 Tax=Aquisalimonas sp. TaxID=1872621 RepID=UPI0025C0B6F7|nr:sulfurtransferase TusA family protein [Aquisalimonas sp.]